MKRRIYSGFFCIVLCFSYICPVWAGSASWTSSTNSSRWVQQPDQAFTPYDNTTANLVEVNSEITYQVIDGWGGCFNELGWTALLVLSQADRETVLRELFDPVTGCKFNLCRMPIGANDFARDYYSLNDSSGDYDMSDFTIDRDLGCLIPYIKAAMAIQLNLKIWGSPWTPPAWMKTNGVYNGGRLTWNAQTLDAYALYFSKYVQTYRNQGIDVYAIHVQNEPIYSTKYPSCLWNAAEFRDFIRDYLGPRFKQDNPDCEIWIGTIPDSGTTNSYADTVLKDTTASSYVSGVGYQYGGKNAIQWTHDTYPSMKLMQTENECGNHENDWPYAEKTFGLMKHYFDHRANSYMAWNPVLDETGLSSWDWAQCSMISINKNTRAVTYNPEFHLYKHFSYFVETGAYRINSGGSFEDRIAFKNPDGDIVVIIANRSDQSKTVTIKNGSEMIKPSIAARSFNTFVIPATGPTPTPGEFQLGDVNHDNTIDIIDALLVAQHYVGLQPGNFYPAQADVSCDGAIDIIDALLIAQFYVGLLSEFCQR
ncbi:MAG: glycosyl hydrolase [Spirochaetales bacterium]|nr:glycosyl hydrolase [Spirochaetales bacterium]